MQRRSNGSSALNESTESSESVSKDDNNTDIVGAKRSRCVSNFMDSDKVNMAASQEVNIFLGFVYLVLILSYWFLFKGMLSKVSHYSII